jgi:hypothetical protein
MICITIVLNACQNHYDVNICGRHYIFVCLGEISLNYVLFNFRVFG